MSLEKEKNEVNKKGRKRKRNWTRMNSHSSYNIMEDFENSKFWLNFQMATSSNDDTVVISEI